MTIIKCKMCGGDIELSADKTFGVCEYCGSTMTFPKIDDDRRAAAFNRGNHFRRVGEFDKALAIYENIVRENDDDAEAHWCCALCRFGIEYVEDPTSHEWLPTCHRASFDSILEDVDYLAALEHSDGVTKRQYEKDAVKIAEVQRGILATSQKEEPFDVFICYKETDDDGQRTRDSLLAQDVYYQLTEKGYRVFFSRITLEDKAGSEYEPYIFAALNSAKVMVCIGTKPEHFSAVWVKNEWSRFLALMRKDRKKLLLPCYRDMDPYDLPEQLSVLQSYDMSKIGFIQDLIRGVSKVVDAQKSSAQSAPTVVVTQSGGNANVDALLKRGRMALEDGEWANADSYYDQVLNINAECAEAYLGKLLAAKRCATLEAHVQGLLARTEQAESSKLEVVPEDRARIEAAKKRWDRPYWEDQAALYRFDRSYASELASRQAQRQQTLSEYDGEKLLHRAAQFADEKLKAELAGARKALSDVLDERVTEAKAADERCIAQLKSAYAEHLDSADAELDRHIRATEESEERLRKEEERKREEDYQSACEEQSAAKTAREFRDAARHFGILRDYKDSATREKACKERVETLEAEAIAAQKRKKTIIIVASLITVVVMIAVIWVVVQIIIPKVHYNKGLSYLTNGQWDSAKKEFLLAGDHPDAKEQVLEADYQKAKGLLDAADYDNAYKTFMLVTGYKDVDIILKNNVELQLAVGNTVTIGKVDGSQIEWKIIGRENGTVVLISNNCIGETVSGRCDSSDIAPDVTFSGGLQVLSYAKSRIIFSNTEAKSVVEIKILSEEEVEKYLPENTDRIADKAWWTSSESRFGSGYVGIRVVKKNGDFYSDATVNDTYGVRPAITIAETSLRRYVIDGHW